MQFFIFFLQDSGARSENSHWEIDEQTRADQRSKDVCLWPWGRRCSTSDHPPISREHMASIFCSCKRRHSRCSHSHSHSPRGSRCFRSHSPRCTPGGSRSCPSSSLERQPQRSCCSAWCQEWRVQEAGECLASV